MKMVAKVAGDKADNRVAQKLQAFIILVPRARHSVVGRMGEGEAVELLIVGKDLEGAIEIHVLAAHGCKYRLKHGSLGALSQRNSLQILLDFPDKGRIAFLTGILEDFLRVFSSTS